MTQTIRTDSNHSDFIALAKFLDAELAERDGAEHSFYDQFNKIANLKHVIVVYENNQPVSCGAIKELTSTAVEVKRMYTVLQQRGKGLASIVLNELETWARQLGYKSCVLETGKRQPEAIELYKKNGYMPIPNYGQYVVLVNSVCFEKAIAIKK